MNSQEPPPQENASWNWISRILIALLILFAAARELANYFGEPGFILIVLLLLAFSLLYVSLSWISRRLPHFLPLYFILQTGLLLVLAVQQPFVDTWAILFIPLAYQVLQVYPRRFALAWIAAFTVCMLLSLAAIFGLWLGVGYGLNYFAAGFLLITFDQYYAQVEANRRESHRLLSELRLASQRLEAYASQADEFAAIREHARLSRELHDSVSQTLFSISLTAQSARILMEKEPQRVPELLDRLQEMTGGALQQMRDLIAQLRRSQEANRPG